MFLYLIWLLCESIKCIISTHLLPPPTYILQSFFGLGQSAEITIELDDVEKRKKVDVKNEDGKKEKLPLYLDGETVTGTVNTRSLSLSLSLLCYLSHLHPICSVVLLISPPPTVSLPLSLTLALYHCGSLLLSMLVDT